MGWSRRASEAAGSPLEARFCSPLGLAPTARPTGRGGGRHFRAAGAEDEDPSEKAAEDLLAWEAPAPLGGDGRQDAWEYPLTSSDCRRRAMRRALGEVARLRRGRPTAPESAHEEWLAWLSSASVSEWEP